MGLFERFVAFLSIGGTQTEPVPTPEEIPPFPPLTAERIEDALQTIIRHGHKQDCDGCGEFNDIDNLTFCLNCMTKYCYRCTNRYLVDDTRLPRTFTHHCDGELLLFDEWDRKKARIASVATPDTPTNAAGSG